MPSHKANAILKQCPMEVKSGVDFHCTLMLAFAPFLKHEALSYSRITFKLSGDVAMTPRKTPGKAKAVSTPKKVATPATSSKSAVAKKKSTVKKTAMSAAKQLAEPTVQPLAVSAENKPDPSSKTRKTEKKTKSLFSAKELEEFYEAMIGLRGRLTVQVAGLREQSLMRHDEVNQDEDGTDAFDRVTSLDRASVDQSRINQINTAIKMIEDGTYGLCESCTEKIEKPRLKALPFAKTCIKCQSEMEGGSIRQRPSIDLLD